MNRSRLEPFLNLALIIVAIAFIASLIARYVKKDVVTGPTKPPIEIGARIDLSGVEWQKNDVTLLFVLSTKCTFCAESMPFYKRIVQEVGERTRLIALFPQDVADARQYLEDQGVAFHDVRQLTPGVLNVSGVPTLILVDRQGIVRDFWLGKVGPNVESVLLTRLKGESDSDGISINSLALRAALNKKEPVVVLSIDDREVYKEDHINAAINIPFDELETRMDDELNPANKIVIYERGTQKYAYHAFEILKNNGFKNVSVLRGGLDKWKQQARRGLD